MLAPAVCYAGSSDRTPQPQKARRDVIASKIFVGNLDYSTNETDLESLFSEVGTVLNVFLPSDRNTGRPRGFAFVEFENDEQVDKAIEKFDGEELSGRAMRINRAEDRPPRPRAPRIFDGPPRGGPPRGGDRPSRPKGSRKGSRAKKRSL